MRLQYTRSLKRNYKNEIAMTRSEFLDGILHGIGLLVAHPEALKLARRFSSVFLIDATYKTNRYSMPLIDYVNVLDF